MHAQVRTRDNEVNLADEKGAGAVLALAVKRIPLAFAFLSLSLLIISASIDVLRYRTGLLDNIGSFDRLFPMFNVDMESSFSTFLSSLMLLTCAAIAFLISRIDAPERAKRWIGMCLLFLTLACDESVMLHEASFKLPLALGLLAVLLTGPLEYPKFLLTIPRTTLAILVAAGVTYLLGALVMDKLDGPFLKEFGSDNLEYKLRATLEEGLEMGGIVLFTTGLVHQLVRLGATELRLGTAMRSFPSRAGSTRPDRVPVIGGRQNVAYASKLFENGGQRAATRNI